MSMSMGKVFRLLLVVLLLLIILLLLLLHLRGGMRKGQTWGMPHEDWGIKEGIALW